MTGSAGARTLASSHDVDLTALAAGGDRSAYGELVRRHGAAARGQLRRLGVEPEPADLLAQAVFLLAYEQIADFRGRTTFGQAVRRLTGRVYLRRRLRQAQAAVRPEAASPPSALVQAERRFADLDAAMAALPLGPRLCVALCYGSGIGPAEVSEVLGAPPEAVRALLRAGGEQLQGLMSKLDASAQAEAAPQAEAEFDSRLHRLFERAPALGGDEAFALLVRRRLDRAWTLRRVVISAVGVLGGLVAVGQLAAARFFGQAEVLSVQSARLMSIALASHVPWRLYLEGLPFGAEILWGVAALCLVALGLVAARLIRDI